MKIWNASWIGFMKTITHNEMKPNEPNFPKSHIQSHHHKLNKMLTLSTSSSATKPLTSLLSLRNSFPFPLFPMELAAKPISNLATGAHRVKTDEASVSLQEWQAWGTSSPVPTMVTQVIQDLSLLEQETNAHMVFGGNHGRLMGDFKIQEDKKHRAKYQSLKDSEEKTQFYAARQIACRLLGSRGYLCQKCWVPLEDCMCSKVRSCSLWDRMRFWLYMHPKDFLRQNNTGKLLWQVFGIQDATLCLYGISEHEDIMWNAFNCSGKENVWCLYINKNVATKSIQDTFSLDSIRNPERPGKSANNDGTLNFILIDATWSLSAAMFKRLKDRANAVWGEDMPCISLNTGVSLMHKLRPQPSWDRTCTAAAAVALLDELHLLPGFNSFGLDKQAEALEDALEVLLEALTTRRLRMGRSITRKQRHSSNIC